MKQSDSEVIRENINKMLEAASEKQLRLIYWAVYEITKKR